MKVSFWFQKLSLQSLSFTFSFHFLHFFFLSFAGPLIYTCMRTIFFTQSQNVLWIVCYEELNIVCFYLMTFSFNVVTLVFYVLAEYESKKMWSKFANVTLASKCQLRNLKPIDFHWSKNFLLELFSLQLFLLFFIK